MRSIKELLELMLNNQKYFRKGLCTWVLLLYYNSKITQDESDLLIDYIKANPPFFVIIRKLLYGGHYWKYRVIEPRIEWIKKHIKKNT